MATKGERQALIFLAAVALLGAGTRVYRARRVAADPAAIDHQIAAIDSVKTGVRVSGRSRRRQPQAEAPPATHNPQPSLPIDLDTAPAEEIERLPGIGPALASRIVSDRAANGPFGCLAALDGVKGIGPALLKRLDSLATFTGPGRPACFKGDAAAGGPSGPAGE